MKLIKRCLGCGKRIYPWQDVIHTKLVGKIHKGCAFSAKYNYARDKGNREFCQRLEVAALEALGVEEIK